MASDTTNLSSEKHGPPKPVKLPELFDRQDVKGKTALLENLAGKTLHLLEDL